MPWAKRRRFERRKQCNAAPGRVYRKHGEKSFGGGTPHFFAQFNRLDDGGVADFLSFTVCHVVHGADDFGPMAGLQSLASLLATACARYPGRALRIGPSSIGARSSLLGRQPASDGTRRIALAGAIRGPVARLAPLGC